MKEISKPIDARINNFDSSHRTKKLRVNGQSVIIEPSGSGFRYTLPDGTTSVLFRTHEELILYVIKTQKINKDRKFAATPKEINDALIERHRQKEKKERLEDGDPQWSSIAKDEHLLPKPLPTGAQVWKRRYNGD
jgi:hypothetical protein